MLPTTIFDVRSANNLKLQQSTEKIFMKSQAALTLDDLKMV